MMDSLPILLLPFVGPSVRPHMLPTTPASDELYIRDRLTPSKPSVPWTDIPKSSTRARCSLPSWQQHGAAVTSPCPPGLRSLASLVVHDLPSANLSMHDALVQQHVHERRLIAIKDVLAPHARLYQFFARRRRWCSASSIARRAPTGSRTSAARSLASRARLTAPEGCQEPHIAELLRQPREGTRQLEDRVKPLRQIPRRAPLGSPDHRDERRAVASQLGRFHCQPIPRAHAPCGVRRKPSDWHNRASACLLAILANQPII